MSELEPDYLSQTRWRCRLEWGRRGALAAAVRGDLLVVVDVLSFSTAVVTACEREVRVYPCRPEDREAAAGRVGAELAVRRSEVPSTGRFSLSPLSYACAEPGTRVALGSPNGATCCALAGRCRQVVVGGLVNASAVSAYVNRALGGDVTVGVTVLACGERWKTPHEGEEVRFALEDYLGAGAVIAGLEVPKSPEALVCEGAFLAARARPADLLLSCGSGLELLAAGYGQDVRCAADLDRWAAVPVVEADGGIGPG